MSYQEASVCGRCNGGKREDNFVFLNNKWVNVFKPCGQCNGTGMGPINWGGHPLGPGQNQ